MTRDGQVLSFAVSGLRGTGRTLLYRELESVLPKEPTLRECEFAFLGNPFGHLPHPLIWVQEGNHKKHGLSRLFECWGMLNDFTEDKWLPALRAGKVPIMDGCGLDAVLYATACIGCVNDDEKVIDWHRAWVQDRLVKQGVQPPHYIITRAEPKQIVNHIARHVNTRLHRNDIRRFVEKERSIIADYFKDGGGQHVPHQLPVCTSEKDMAFNAVASIRRLTHMRVAA